MGDATPEQGATGRRWRVSISIAGFGGGVLIFGLVTTSTPAIGAGFALMAFFGAIAAGARKARVGTDTVQAEADFTAPAPPKEPGRIYLPRGRGSKPRK